MLNRLLFSPLINFLATRLVALLVFTKSSCDLFFIWSYVVLWLLVAVHFISKLTKWQVCPSQIDLLYLKQCSLQHTKTRLLRVTTADCNNRSASLWCFIGSIIAKAVTSYLAGVVLRVVTVVLIHCSKSRMQHPLFPRILCASLSYLSVTTLIFCVTDFVSAIKQNVSIDF